MKRFIQILLFVLFAASVAGVMGFIYIEQGKQPVKDVIIKIEQKSNKGFLNESIIKNLISDYDSLLNKNANQVKPAKIERDILENPFVVSADVFVDIDKNLIINIAEKEALLRVYNRRNDGFYIDQSGNVMPLSTNYTARVMIANGYINVDLNESQLNILDTSYAKTPLPDLYELTKLISRNNFLKAQIGQIYVNSQGEYDLIPQLGNHLIRFGTKENASQKLENLELFYKEALIREGWDKYEVISLKYKNQVVCKRK
jgi:cell division protein FtsQ